MKQLTIAVPAYNAEKYIKRCLDSMVLVTGRNKKKPDGRLEVIVVNDGSTDDTGQLAKEYANAYPDIVRVIDKSNGGHGSGINAAIKSATGRYFKVIDSDDWIETDDISKILTALEDIKSDVVVTGYTSVNEKTQSILKYPASDDENIKILGMDEFAEVFESIPSSYVFHGLCYRTDFYRRLQLKLSEGVLYEDQEYAILPFAKADKITLLPYYLYVYRLGSASQSVDYANQEKHADDHRAVLEKMVEYHLKEKAGSKGSWSEKREDFFIKRLAVSAVSYYAIVLVKAEDRKKGKEKALELKKYLEEKEPEVAAYSESRYKKLKLAGMVPGAAKLYGRVFDSPVYVSIKKYWVK